jgi:SAM-dependent methyltransferase
MHPSRRVVPALVRQAHQPTGVLGNLLGWVLGRRPSNVARNRWVVDLLDLKPSDVVIELGCGPGVAVAAMAQRVVTGSVVGVDHSAVMIRQARRRNRAAVRSGRVRLALRSVEDLHDIRGPFDVALAVNTVGMWPNPSATLRGLREMLRPEGTIALVSQPRCPGADPATSVAAADELASLLLQAGFTNLRTRMLALNPPAACVLASPDHAAPTG